MSKLYSVFDVEYLERILIFYTFLSSVDRYFCRCWEYKEIKNKICFQSVRSVVEERKDN